MDIDIRVGDVGTIIRITIKDENENIVDISQVITKTMTFKKPNGLNINKTPTFFTDGSDGKMQYTTIEGDIDQQGLWQLQAKVIFADGSWYTNIYKFWVVKNL